jgi:hypothetical protein
MSTAEEPIDYVTNLLATAERDTVFVVFDDLRKDEKDKSPRVGQIKGPILSRENLESELLHRFGAGTWLVMGQKMDSEGLPMWFASAKVTVV